MRAQIQHTARPHVNDHQCAAPCVIRIDGVDWSSPMPSNAGEAETFNRDAQAIVDALNGTK